MYEDGGQLICNRGIIFPNILQFFLQLRYRVLEFDNLSLDHILFAVDVCNELFIDIREDKRFLL